jgi:hypothetical protein
MKKTLLILAIFANTLFSNDSFYTPTTDKQVIHHDEGYVEVLVESPTDYNVSIGDCGGFTMQLSINGYSLQTVQIPTVIEWRMNEKKKIIGAIVRTYMPIFDSKRDDFIKDKYSSVFNVLFFEDEPILLGTRVSNHEARELIDDYYKRILRRDKK